METLQESLKAQIKHAFHDATKGNVAPPEFEVLFEKGVIFVPNTQIRFDLSTYAFLGYRKMADFAEACWENPREVVDEFLLSGLIPDPERVSYGQYSVSIPKEHEQAEGYQDGEIELEDIRQPLAIAPDEGLRFVGCAFLAKSFFSDTEEVFIPGGKFLLSDLQVEIDHEEDSYEDCWIGHHIVYATGTLKRL